MPFPSWHSVATSPVPITYEQLNGQEECASLSEDIPVATLVSAIDDDDGRNVPTAVLHNAEASAAFPTAAIAKEEITNGANHADIRARIRKLEIENACLRNGIHLEEFQSTGVAVDTSPSPTVVHAAVILCGHYFPHGAKTAAALVWSVLTLGTLMGAGWKCNMFIVRIEGLAAPHFGYCYAVAKLWPHGNNSNGNDVPITTLSRVEAVGIVGLTYLWTIVTLVLIYVTLLGCTQLISRKAWRGAAGISTATSISILLFQVAMQWKVCSAISENNCDVGSLGGALGWTAAAASSLTSLLLGCHACCK